MTHSKTRTLELVSTFRLTSEPIDPAACRRAAQRSAAGGFAVFEGWVRDRNEGRRVLLLEYEAYRALAEKEGERIIREARDRYDILHASAVHRVGRLEVGELAVWIGVAAVHRGPAFDACRYIIDELKTRVPIWKREHYTDGSAEWVNCAGCTPGHLVSDALSEPSPERPDV